MSVMFHRLAVEGWWQRRGQWCHPSIHPSINHPSINHPSIHHKYKSAFTLLESTPMPLIHNMAAMFSRNTWLRGAVDMARLHVQEVQSCLSFAEWCPLGWEFVFVAPQGSENLYGHVWRPLTHTIIELVTLKSEYLCVFSLVLQGSREW